jgi:hypothetical protein
MWNSECGLRPLRAVGSMLYEPEAIGAYAYAPVGMRKEKKAQGFECGMRNAECGKKKRRYRYLNSEFGNKQSKIEF